MGWRSSVVGGLGRPGALPCWVLGLWGAVLALAQARVARLFLNGAAPRNRRWALRVACLTRAGLPLAVERAVGWTSLRAENNLCYDLVIRVVRRGRAVDTIRGRYGPYVCGTSDSPPVLGGKTLIHAWASLRSSALGACGPVQPRSARSRGTACGRLSSAARAARLRTVEHLADNLGEFGPHQGPGLIRLDVRDAICVRTRSATGPGV